MRQGLHEVKNRAAAYYLAAAAAAAALPAGAAQQRWPRIAPKAGLKPQSLLAEDFMIAIPGCLTTKEAEQFIAAAEAVGFQHQSSRGPAYGEVRCWRL